MRRRALLQSLPFAAALPFGAAAAAPVESIDDKVVRLARELSAALGEFYDGQFKALVGPDDDIVLNANRDKTAQERFDHHLAGFKRAAEDLDPMIGHWQLSLPEQDGAPVSLVGNRVTGRYEGDGIYQSGSPNVFGRHGEWRVTRRPDQMIDGERTFIVECPGERRTLPESRLETFIGRRLVAGGTHV